MPKEHTMETPAVGQILKLLPKAAGREVLSLPMKGRKVKSLKRLAAPEVRH